MIARRSLVNLLNAHVIVCRWSRIDARIPCATTPHRPTLRPDRWRTAPRRECRAGSVAEFEFQNNDVGLLLGESREQGARRLRPLFSVVVTMPKSEKIIVSEAPASSIASTSRRSDTPVALHAATWKPQMPQPAHDGAGGGRLARIHAGARECDHGNARVSICGSSQEHLAARPRRYTDAFAEVQEAQDGAEYLAVERRTDVRIRGVADAEHAANIQDLDRVARLQ